MLFTILAIGIGLIIALGGAIMLDRNPTPSPPHAASLSSPPPCSASCKVLVVFNM